MTSTAFEQVLLHRGDGGVDQLRPVEHGLGVDPRRERSLHLRHLRVDAGGNGAAVRAEQHDRCGDDHFLAVLAGRAVRSSRPIRSPPRLARCP